MGTINNYNLCFWFSRRERGMMLGEELQKQFGANSTLYHNLGISRPSIKHIKAPSCFRDKIIKGLKYLLITNYDIYFTSKYFIPALQLTILHLLTGKSFIVGIYSPKWNLIPHSKHKVFKVYYKYLYIVFLRIVFSNASYVVCNSNFLKTTFSKKYPTLRKKIKCIYNGIDYNTFTRRSGIVSHSKKHFIGVSTANSESKTQGLLLLISAFKDASKQYNNINLTLLIKSKTPEYKKQIMEVIKGINNIFLIFNEENVNKYLQKAHFFIFITPPNTSDSLPRSIIEASAVGLPVLATTSAGNGEIVVDKKTGILCRYSQCDIVSGITRMAEMNEKEYNTMSKKAMNYVQKKFCWKKMAKDYNNLIETIVN